MTCVSRFTFCLLFIFSGAVKLSAPPHPPHPHPNPPPLPEKSSNLNPILRGGLTFRAPPAKVAPPRLRPPPPPRIQCWGCGASGRQSSQAAGNAPLASSRVQHASNKRSKGFRGKPPPSPCLPHQMHVLCLGCEEVLLGQVKSGPDAVCCELAGEGGFGLVFWHLTASKKL